LEFTLLCFSLAMNMCSILLSASLASASARTILVTGATGQTGSEVYLSLKAQGHNVRGLVRNVTKAKQRLGCSACDESDGIFVGDVTEGDSISDAMVGADSLVITTGPAYHCLIPSAYIGCKYYDGADPETMSWKAVRTQVSTFAASKGPALKDRHVVLMSNTLTTVPNNFLDKIDSGSGCFYGLNGEAFLMSSGLPFTVIKANGLNNDEPMQKEILVGRDDEEGWKPTDLSTAFISRKDVARMISYAANSPSLTTAMRFDVTSRKGDATIELATVFNAARLPWDSRSGSDASTVHI